MQQPQEISKVEKALISLVKEYQALNSLNITELHFTPTSLGFSRFVALNRPLIIRGEGQRSQISALEKWSNNYLIEKLGDKKVRIAVSPDGKADSIVGDLFVEPAEVSMRLSEFFPLLNNIDPNSEVWYLQSQNGNLSVDGELSTLLDDVGSGPSFAREVFANPPDVANIWIGDSRSITSLHKDPYENIYLVIRGEKTFTLLPPTEFYTLHEKEFPHAQYIYTPSTSSTSSSFTIQKTSPSIEIPWIQVDPTSPNLKLHPRFIHAKPITITLKVGDMLYLPSLWYHRVAQKSGSRINVGGVGEEETEVEAKAAIAVNWWFDLDMEGPHWCQAQFLRRTVLLLDGREEGLGMLDD